jgi:chromosome transmission fidelity protein 1
MDDDIPFPFPPYPQQRDLMKSIRHCIESSSVGCFESPTGTGKSLSTICATLSWQFKEEERILEEQSVLASKRNSGSSDDWLMAFQTGFVSDTAELKRTRKAYDLHLAMKARILRTLTFNQRRQERSQFGKLGSTKVGQNSNNTHNPPAVSTTELEDEFSLKHYDSDDEQVIKSSTNHRHKSVLDDGDIDDEDEDELTNPLCLPKIFYCSRTHSQISQFVGEIKRTAFSNARCITLGSRRNMCINPDVVSYGSDSKMSEVCLEMHKSKSKKDVLSENLVEPLARKQKTTAVDIKPCPFHSKSKEHEFADHALGMIRDIESLTTLGDILQACPYYATRKALRDAQVRRKFHDNFLILLLRYKSSSSAL